MNTPNCLAISLDQQAFSIWNTSANKWAVAPGTYGVPVGNSSRHLPLQGKVTISSK